MSDPEEQQTAASGFVARVAARVLVVDESGALLLLRGQDPGDLARGPWWFTPGGGLDPGETFEDGARRELFEETGFAASALGPVVYERTTSFPFEGVWYRQTEQFFAVRTARFEPVDDHWSDVERRSVLGHRWWTRAELETTDETVYPENLAAILGDLLT